MLYLWEDKSDDKLSILGNTGDLLFHIVNTKVTLLMIGGIVAATLNNKLLGLAITLCFSAIGYVIIKEVFERFWHGFNRSYAISNDGIHFEWGLRRKHELFVPFSSIIKVTLVGYRKSALSTIYFDTNDNTILDRYPQLATDESFKLSFDKIKNGDKVISLLQNLRKDVKTIAPQPEDDRGIYKYIPLWINRVYCFVAFLFLCYGTFNLISIFDFHLLGYTEVETTITKQKYKGYYNHNDYHKLHTQEGYTFDLETGRNLTGTTITLGISPLFSRVIFVKLKHKKSHKLLSCYSGLSLLSRLLTLIVTLVIGIYILYRRGYISIEDVGLFIIFPLAMILVSNSLFGLSYVG